MNIIYFITKGLEYFYYSFMKLKFKAKIPESDLLFDIIIALSLWSFTVPNNRARSTYYANMRPTDVPAYVESPRPVGPVLSTPFITLPLLKSSIQMLRLSSVKKKEF